jgi:uncharacterized damage-inducible protein DinB
MRDLDAGLRDAVRHFWLTRERQSTRQFDDTDRDRGSRGTLFTTTLGDVILQMFVHSTHHRAQAVNMLRHLGVSHPQVDYMMLVRQPV